MMMYRDEPVMESSNCHQLFFNQGLRSDLIVKTEEKRNVKTKVLI